MVKGISKKLHFKEIDWIIYFPSIGNEGRFLGKYGVAYRNRKSGESQPGVRINLEDVLSMPDIRNKYPHTIGFFIDASGKGATYLPEYLKIQKINNESELYGWMKQLSL